VVVEVLSPLLATSAESGLDTMITMNLSSSMLYSDSGVSSFRILPGRTRFTFAGEMRGSRLPL
jgi:hypothetical protein